MKRIIVTAAVLFLALVSNAGTLGRFSRGTDSLEFIYEPLADKPIMLYYYIPTKGDVTDMKVLIAFHGAERLGINPIIIWREFAERDGFVVLAPQFSRSLYDENQYQFGNVFKDRTMKELNPEEEWVYSAVEPMFEFFKKETGNRAERYSIQGHSAGGQFVHRYLIAKPDAKVDRAVASNPGTWTWLSSNGVIRSRQCGTWPYTIKGTPFDDERHIKAYLERNLTVHLGTLDTATSGKHVPDSPQALAEGRHRYRRGLNYFADMKAFAEKNGYSFGWKKVEVKGMGHRGRGMAYGCSYRDENGKRRYSADKIRPTGAYSILFGDNSGKGKGSPFIYPTDEGWAKAKPSKYGYDPDKLKEVRKYLIDSTHCTGMTVIVGGESIFRFGSLDRISYIASCRKSVLAMLYGKYVENGTIDLGRTIGELGMDDHGGLLPSEKEATVFDLVTARSGIYHPASNDGDDQAFAPARGSVRHGEQYLYNNWDFNAAGAAFEIMTGKNIFDAFEEDIAIPIGMEDWDRSIHKKSGDLRKSRYPAYHFHLTTRDMARLGYLMLRKGNWNGTQVISENWVKTITSPVTPFRDMYPEKRRDRFSYGYMWWLFADESKLNGWQYHGGYIAQGAMGQYIMVLPELDMVVAFKTDSVYGRRSTKAQLFALMDLIFEAKIR